MSSCWPGSRTSPKPSAALGSGVSSRWRSPDALAGTSHGTCEGVIAREPRGENGFGYDPIFHLPGLGLRMAELSQEHKNQISHRGQALSGALRTVREAVSR